MGNRVGRVNDGRKSAFRLKSERPSLVIDSLSFLGGHLGKNPDVVGEDIITQF